MVGFLLKVTMTVIASIWMLGPVLAHSKMSESNPADGGTVEAGLERIEIGFKKAVRLVRINVKRKDEAAKIPTFSKLSSDYHKEHGVNVAPLTAGSYRVNWTAIAKDGHVMKGGMSFKVQP